MYTKEQIEAAVKAKGYTWFEDASNKGFDVNIIGIRNSSTGKKVTNIFDDYMTISYKENGVWKSHVWACTTDPGTKAVKEFKNPNGGQKQDKNPPLPSFVPGGDGPIACHSSKRRAWRSPFGQICRRVVSSQTKM